MENELQLVNTYITDEGDFIGVYYNELTEEYSERSI